MMCRGAACTVVGNALLADAARPYARRVEVIPTLVDTDRYKMKDPATAPPSPRVAWLGSDLSIRETLLPHLDILAEAQRSVRFRLVVISRPRPQISHPTLDWSYLEWTPEVERNIADRAEIGIMPLQDTPFQRAKCGLKLLEYMAAGLPAIASPVGASGEIARKSKAARLASSAAEWTAALAELCGAASLRAELGAIGRRYCVTHYSIAAWLPRWLALLDEVAQASAPP
jgi:glycosyltransferase involved in cell wall biosynthesis